MARTPKGRALGKALRQARESRGLTLRAFGDQIGRDPAVISRWETGDRTPKPEQVAQVLTALGVTGSQYEEIMSLSYGTDAPLWVATALPEQHQQLMALIDCEQSASKITGVAPLLIPGLLQTTEYIRAIMVGARVPAGEVATRVALRIGRQEILNRPNPIEYVALLSPFVLTNVIGDRSIMIDQLRHLVGMAQRPNIELRIIRNSGGWNPSLDGPFILIEFDEMAPVVHLENRRSSLFLHEDGDVGTYKLAVEMVMRVSMSRDESIRLIRGLTDRMEKGT